jgi:dihydroorotate dehydrogenase (NAD+) catalytic subunit
MIELSTGHRFEYMAASGSLAYDGRGWPWEHPLRWGGLMDPSLFTVVTKTLTRQPRRGNLRWWNPFRCVRFLSGGVVNAVGLTNPGIEWWCREIGPTVRRRKVPIVVSLLSDSAAELVEMAGMVRGFDIVGIELNASCPNTGADMSNAWKVVDACHAIKAVSDLPLILKLSVIHDHRTILEQVGGDVVEAVAINSVPWNIAFSRKRQSPLGKFGGGGVSGKAVQNLTWNMVRRLAGTVPVIGPSVWEYDDIARLRTLGASAVSFGSVFLRYPWRPTLFARRDAAERKKSCQQQIR